MALAYLPDTNILSAYIKGERSVGLRLREADYFISSVVLGELYEWAFKSPRPERLKAVRAIVEIAPILVVDEITSERYGRIVVDLLKMGHLISGDDLWIAAQASQYDLIIATRDSDFHRIPNIRLEQW